MDAETISKFITVHLKEIRYCYESKGLSSNPRLAGTVEVTFTIRASGRVGQAMIRRTTLNSTPAEQCIKSAVKRWRFPQPRSSMTFVTYPFHFKPPSQ